MIEVLRAEQRHFSDFGWLQTYWLFSFSSYFDPRNMQFGALRVFNDDVVQPGTGFPTHPHEEMEIVTLVLDGEVTHADSMGNRTVIRAGDVQRMSAGTGLTHSEFNLADRPARFYQVWILPDAPRLEPSYDQRSFDPAAWHNRILPVASGRGLPGVVTFHTDATLCLASLEAGRRAAYAETAGRRLFLYVTRGRLAVNGCRLGPKDQARADVEEPLEIEAQEDAEWVLIDLPSCKGWGYGEDTLRGGRPPAS